LGAKEKEAVSRLRTLGIAWMAMRMSFAMTDSFTGESVNTTLAEHPLRTAQLYRPFG